LTWLDERDGTVSPLRALLSRLWPFGGSDPDTDRGDGADGDASVWDAVPSWQYGGRHAESGGIARAEQERALRDLDERADAEEEVDRWR
jgi:hypothetical protein